MHFFVKKFAYIKKKPYLCGEIKIRPRMREITEIIVHCTANTERCKLTPSQIIQDCQKRIGDKGGYHYIIDLDGKLHVCYPTTEVAHHAEGHNKHSIGIAYIGGLDLDAKTPKNTLNIAQADTLRICLLRLVSVFPAAKIKGHNEISNKACPSFDVQDFCKKFGICQRNFFT